MLIMSIIHLPAIIINMFGASMQYESNIAAITTLGNIGSASDVELITIPGCNEEEFHFDNCTISKLYTL